MRQWHMDFRIGDIGMRVTAVDEIGQSAHPAEYLASIVLDALYEVDQRRTKEEARLREQLHRRTRFIVQNAPVLAAMGMDPKEISDALR